MQYTIKDMEYKLIAAKVDLEVAQEVCHTLAYELREAIKACANKCICDATGSEVLRAWHRYDYHDREFNLMFELGFYNEIEERIDFGSDVSFYFSKSKGLTINHGTIGTFGKEHVYQFKRMKMMGYIAENIETIEQAFSDVIDEYIAPMTTAEHTENEAQSAVTAVKLGIEKIKRSNIDENLSVGNILSYNKETNVMRRLFYIPCVDEWVVKKITPKRVYVFPNKPDSIDDYTKCINRNDLITHIYNGSCNIKD